jgi:hypothetical protein
LCRRAASRGAGGCGAWATTSGGQAFGGVLVVADRAVGAGTAVVAGTAVGAGTTVVAGTAVEAGTTVVAGATPEDGAAQSEPSLGAAHDSFDTASATAAMATAGTA